MATSGDIRPYQVISDRHVNVASTETRMNAAITMLDWGMPDACGGGAWDRSERTRRFGRPHGLSWNGLVNQEADSVGLDINVKLATFV
jgi:hypothetical protein